MMKAKKTLTMISAADVMTRPVVPMPVITAGAVVRRARSHASLMCVIRNTS